MLNRLSVGRRYLVLLPGAVLCCVVLGCSADDGLERRYAVSGTVNYKGEPVSKANIAFVPAGKNPPTLGAHGSIEDGYFALSTLNPGDGVLPGEYDVIIEAKDYDEEAIKTEAVKLAARHGIGQPSEMLIAELRGKAAKKAKRSVPPKYESPATCNLRVTVEQTSNTFKFDLVDDGS